MSKEIVSRVLPFCALLLIATAIMPMVPVSGYTTHAAITILGDSGFTAANGVTGGTGTSLDPYIISGWDITASPNGIVIQTTLKYFTITGCKFTGTNSQGSGISMQNVGNGTITQNTFSQLTNGISLQDGFSMTVSQNTITNVVNGVSAQDTRLINILGNTFDTATNGIAVQDIHGAKINQNTFKANTNGVAMQDQSSNDEISDNAFNTGNTAIAFSDVSNVTIHNNEFSNASNSAIKISGTSKNNLIYLNDFRNNNNGGKQAETAVSGNTWYNASQSKGNFWSDWLTPDANNDGIVDTPYVISAGIASDNFPLTKPLKGAQPVLPIATSLKADKINGTAPLLVTFTVTASGGTAPLTNAITYGDGHTNITSTHTYTTGGSFVAFVTTVDSKGVSKVSASITITVAPPIPALGVNITSTTTTGKTPLAVGFTSTVTGGVTPYNYTWDFGDGSQKSYDANPTHIYKSTGYYDAKVTVKDSKGTTKSDSVHIVALSVPKKPAGFIPGFEPLVLVAAVLVAVFIIGRRKA